MLQGLFPAGTEAPLPDFSSRTTRMGRHYTASLMEFKRIVSLFSNSTEDGVTVEIHPLDLFRHPLFLSYSLTKAREANEISPNDTYGYRAIMTSICYSAEESLLNSLYSGGPDLSKLGKPLSTYVRPKFIPNMYGTVLWNSGEFVGGSSVLYPDPDFGFDESSFRRILPLNHLRSDPTLLR
jgi:hypothetical protein